MPPVTRPTWVKAIEMFCVYLSVVLIFTLGFYVFRAISTPTHVAVLFLAAFSGYLLADFVSGFFHWFFDNFFEENTPWLGKYVITPFRHHHRDPLALTRHDYYGRNGNNCFILNPFLLAAFLARGEVVHLPGFFGIAFFVFFGIGVFATNQIHSWAHLPSNGAFVRFLRKIHLILTPEAHAVHHRGDHNQSYCVTSGWMNPMLNRLHIFTLFEKAFVFLGFPMTKIQEFSLRDFAEQEGKRRVG